MATSSTQSGFVDSWQRGKTVIECNLHMLETKDFTVVTFLVGSKKNIVQAYRYVLVSRSCVFHAMFCGRMAEQGKITIPDIEVNVFRDFLRFLYTDSCTISSENVAGLLYSSRKYDVDTLFKQSTSFLETSLSEENLCEILEKSHGYGEMGLEQKVLKMLSKAGPNVIKSTGFLELCSGSFGTFLKSKNLNLKEEAVFEAALSWTKAECEREGLSPSHENMRKVLGEMVYEIRFASLSIEYLAKVVGPSGILTGDERLKIIDNILESSNDFSPFKSDPRGNMVYADEQASSVIHYVKRFKTLQQPSHQGPNHAISFTTNKRITLLGCQLYGSDTQQTTRLSIELFNADGNPIYCPVWGTDWTLSNKVNDVMFTNPVSINAGYVYTIYVHYGKYINLYSGSNGVSRVNVGGVEFTFQRCSFIVSKSDIIEGQISGLIWQHRFLQILQCKKNKTYLAQAQEVYPR